MKLKPEEIMLRISYLALGLLIGLQLFIIGV